MGTKLFSNRTIAAALIALGCASAIALPVWDMKEKDEQTHSELLRLLVVKSLQESAVGAIVIFQTGQKARLSRDHKEYQFHLTLAKRSLERAHPVGVRINSAGEISEMVRADNDYVKFLTEENQDTVKVWFQGHDGIAHLERHHPRFDNIVRDLNRSLEEKKRIWFVWRLPGLMLEDVMILEHLTPGT